MAIQTSYPGVYIEELESGVRPIEGASTSTAVFIGDTGMTVEVQQQQQQQRRNDDGELVFNFDNEPVMETVTVTVSVPAPTGKPKLIFTWQDYLNAFGGVHSDTDLMGLSVYNFFLNGGGAAYIVHLGSETSALDTLVFPELEKIREISIICMPGNTWPDKKNVLEKAVTHAEKMKNRMVIIDLDNTVLEDASSVDGIEGDETNPGLKLTKSEFAVAYYPWIEVANPLYKPADPDSGAPAEGGSPTVSMGPSGLMAGMWAKIDGRRGVWKAPAGIETSLLGVAGMLDYVNDARQGILNPLGINCIRKMPGFGPVVWGARTLATKVKADWRYVPVRRTASMLEESIYNNIQWAVFEPNDHRLWSSLRINIGAFMNGLWRAGAFQGEKSSDAYFVRCNLGDTMTQDDIDLGKVIVDVGFAPLKPAEFVIVRIQQKVAQQ